MTRCLHHPYGIYSPKFSTRNRAVNRMHKVLSQHLRICDCIGRVLRRSHRLDCERTGAGGRAGLPRLPREEFHLTRAERSRAERGERGDGHKKWKSRHSSSSIQVRPSARPPEQNRTDPSSLPPDRVPNRHQLPLRLICCRRDATEEHNGGQP